MLDIGVMWMSKALLPSSSSSWYREGQEQSNTVGLCTHVLVFLSNPACRFLQRMGTTLLCPNMQPHQNLTTVTCSKGNLLRAVRGSVTCLSASFWAWLAICQVPWLVDTEPWICLYLHVASSLCFCFQFSPFIRYLSYWVRIPSRDFIFLKKYVFI